MCQGQVIDERLTNSLGVEQETLYRADISKVKFTSKELILCRLCKGEGIVTESKFRGHTEGVARENYVCPDCKGKGRLREIREIRFERL